MLELRPDAAVIGSIAACAAGAMLLLADRTDTDCLGGSTSARRRMGRIQGRRIAAVRRQSQGAASMCLLTGEADWALEIADGSLRRVAAPLAAARVLRWWFIRNARRMARRHGPQHR